MQKPLNLGCIFALFSFLICLISGILMMMILRKLYGEQHTPEDLQQLTAARNQAALFFIGSGFALWFSRWLHRKNIHVDNHIDGSL